MDNYITIARMILFTIVGCVQQQQQQQKSITVADSIHKYKLMDWTHDMAWSGILSTYHLLWECSCVASF